MNRIDISKHLNDLTLSKENRKEYLKRTKSYFKQKGLGQGHLHALVEMEHPAPFSFQDISRLMGLLTKKGDRVLDPFMGIGSTCKAAILEERNVVGIELIDRWIDLAKFRLDVEVISPKSFVDSVLKLLENKKLNDSKRIKQLAQKYRLPQEEDLFKKIIQCIRKNMKKKSSFVHKLIDMEKTKIPQKDIFKGDARIVLKDLISKNEKFDFIITSPPYWKILNKKADHKQKAARIEKGLVRNYGEDVKDLANIKCYEDFLDELTEIFFNCYELLKEGKYIVIIVQDFRHENTFVSFHSDIINRLIDKSREKHFELQGNQIILQDWKKLFPYGQPTAYVQNEHHQYALIFKKPKR